MLQHVAGPAGVLADDDAGLMIPAVVPADEPSDLVRVLYGQILVGFAAETVCSKAPSPRRSPLPCCSSIRT